MSDQHETTDAQAAMIAHYDALDFDQDQDPGEEDGPDPGAECGRWRNGRLSSQCLKAGSEECDWECPYR